MAAIDSEMIEILKKGHPDKRAIDDFLNMILDEIKKHPERRLPCERGHVLLVIDWLLGWKVNDPEWLRLVEQAKAEGHDIEPRRRVTRRLKCASG